ncbi:DMT family transporter [Pseudoalteromonas lipolytica]|uniref:DMT family transporter n=1 Tax=Pseudoalteromonas lipolytica TaxID=570156 RepID=UPI003A971478
MAFFSSIEKRILLHLKKWRKFDMQLFLILIVIAGGMGLSVEAGLLGPLGTQVGDLWATFSIFAVGAALTFLLMLFFSPRNSASFFSQPSWQLSGGVLGVVYVVILTVATPKIGIAMTMIGILAGQISKSLIIDHFGLFGTPHRRIDNRRIIALIFIIIALAMVAQG